MNTGEKKKPQTCSYPRMAVLAPDTREITVLSLARSEPLAVLRDHTVPDRLELTEKKIISHHKAVLTRSSK
jgi:hypothetical protein